MRLKTERLAVEIIQMEIVACEYELFDRLREEGIPEYEAIQVLDMMVVEI